MPEPVSVEELYKRYLECGQLICTDTRKIIKGSIFFALKGANFNANEFAAKAIEQGCSYAVIDEEKYFVEGKTFLTDDVLKELQRLANYHRKQLSIPFLAITGSNAKTTHKELINAVLSKKYRTLATTGNLNNHIGVPLTLLEIKKEHEFAIIEMGANHKGEIDELCRIAEPDYGLITNIGKAHLEGFGGIEGVKQGKSELYKFLKVKQGKVFVNGDDETLMQLCADNDKITYGAKKLYDMIGKELSPGNDGDLGGVRFKFTTRYGEKDWNKLPEIQTNMVGSYNFINCLAAAAIGNYFKISDEQIREALEEYSPNMNRSQLIKTEKNIILLDAYNANPNSMKAAIENFAGYKAGKKMLLLGDMFELGEYSAEEHNRIAELLKEKKFTNVILVGQEFSKLDAGPFKTFKTTSECFDYLKNLNVEGTTILIKGSRGMKMETLKEAL
jgi:UDP-N-acetylmuramoyl-tripeptide--D-alanyl-D-alanine ligase